MGRMGSMNKENYTYFTEEIFAFASCEMQIFNLSVKVILSTLYYFPKENRNQTKLV